MRTKDELVGARQGWLAISVLDPLKDREAGTRHIGGRSHRGGRKAATRITNRTTLPSFPFKPLPP